MTTHHPFRGSARRATALAFVAVSFIATAFSARAQVGSSAVVFLKIEPDSRTAGMGNAGVALADNAAALFWNPAGLAFQKGTEASITHANWLPQLSSDLFYEYLTAKHHVPGWGTFGGHLTYLFLGEHEGRDAQNNPTGTFKSYDLAVGLSYGAKVGRNFGLGTSLRFIYSNLAPGQVVGAQETKAGVSTAFDVAGLYRVPEFNLGSIGTNVSFGFNLANMGPKIQYSDSQQADPIPTNLRVGYAVQLDFDDYNSLTLVTDFNKDLIHETQVDSLTRKTDEWYQAIFSSWKPVRVQTNALNEDEARYETLSILDQFTIGAGFEYWYGSPRLFAVRSGYFYEHPYNGNRKFLTLGAGVRYNIIGVDFSYIYALQEESPLANTMRFSLLLNFDR